MHRYDFLNVRERAIREVYGTVTAQQQREQQVILLPLSVAEKYDVPPERLLPSLITLVMRSTATNRGRGRAHLSARHVPPCARP